MLLSKLFHPIKKLSLTNLQPSSHGGYAEINSAEYYRKTMLENRMPRVLKKIAKHLILLPGPPSANISSGVNWKLITNYLTEQCLFINI